MIKFVYTTNLPYCLALKDDEYKVLYRENEYLLRTKKVWTNYANHSDSIEEYEGEIKTPYGMEFISPEYDFGKIEENFIDKYRGKNLEFIDDDSGHFRLTVISVTWNSETNYLEENNSTKLEAEMLGLLNRFIEIYRITTNSHFFPLLMKIPFHSLATILKDDTEKGKIIYDSDVQKVTFIKTKPQHEDFRAKLTDLDFLTSTRLSLSRAKHYYSKSQYPNSVTEAVIALEPVVHNAVKFTWAKRGISNNKIKEQIRKIGLHYMVSIEILHILNISLDNPTDRLLYDNVLDSIKLRNRIIHKNFNDVTKVDASKTIEAIEKMVDRLTSKITPEN